MKCKYCGGNLNLEAEFCPYCGRENDQATKHIKAMRGYQKSFERTKKEVVDKTNKYTGVTVRVVTASILLVIILLLVFIGTKAYEIRRAWLENKSLVNATEYMERMDTFLEEEDFIGFTYFIDEKFIHCYDTVFEKYIYAERVAQNYTYVYLNVMDIVTLNEYQDAEVILEILVDSLDSFYDSLNAEQYQYYENVDNELCTKSIETMEKQVNLMLQSYCGLSEEDANNFKNLTKAKQAVLLEDALLNNNNQ